MTTLEAIIFISILWNVFGLCILCGLENSRSSPIGWCPDSSYFHYRWIYDNYEYNHFGTVVMFVFINAVCPIATICHWVYYGMYKLFTIGRR